MKIGIDISLTVGEKAGVGYYTANLVDALAKIDRVNQYLLYPFFYYICHPDFKTAVAPHQKNFYLHYEKNWHEARASHQTNENFALKTQFPFPCSIV